MDFAARTPSAHEPSRASALIYNRAGEYLLHLRDNLPGLIAEPGAWSLLGGGREPGDRSLAETIQRELREEAGLVIPDLEPFAVEQVSPVITVQIFTGRWEGDPSTLNLTEGVMLHWFRPETMPRLRIAETTASLVQRHVQTVISP